MQSLYDVEAEQILLHDLLFSSQRKELLQICFPSIFHAPETKDIFEIIKSQGDSATAFSVSRELIRRQKSHKADLNTETATAMVMDFIMADEVTKYWRGRYDPYQLIKYLKELLYKRLAKRRASAIVQLIENENVINIDQKIFAEIDKILILGKTLIKSPKTDFDELASSVSDRVNSLHDIIRTGFPFLNKRLMGLTRRQISSILARPKHLKSSFSDQLVSTTIEKNESYTGLIISLEDPAEERVKRICARILDISLADMRFKKVKLERAEVLRVLKVVLGGRLKILDPRDILTPEDAVAAINDFKPDLAVVDHIQKFVVPDMVMGMIQAVKQLETAAIRNDCHIVITSQVGDKNFRGREDKSPTASDAQWTSALYQSSSEMFSLYWKYQDSNNAFERHLLTLDITASRYADAIGRIILHIDADKSRFIGEVEH